MRAARLCGVLMAMLLPVSAIAQTAAVESVQVDPAKVYGSMIRTAERAAVGLAEAMPEDKYSFVPSADFFHDGKGTEFKNVRTFAQQIAHIASSNYEYLQAMGLEKDKDFAAVEKLTTKAEVLQALKDSFAAAEKAAAAITAQNVFEGLGPKKATTRAGLASAIAWHTMDHYGQLVIYARMNGVVPPQSR